MIAKLKSFYQRHERAALILFFIGGFIWDSLTLQRIDHLYSNFVLFTYLICLMISLYVFNLADDGHWKDTFLEKHEEYAPLAVQFFLGGLSSAYVVFFFRSVSLTKTMVFFILLVLLLISNEVFKHRLSNKYLQFGAFFFITFTFFAFIIPIFAGTMSTLLFVIAGVAALTLTLFFTTFIYRKSPSTRDEISLKKLSGIVAAIYLCINVFYYFNMIPPVPLSLKTGMMAYQVDKSGGSYFVEYDRDKRYKFWKSFNHDVFYSPGDTIYAFTSVFAPTNLNKSVAHRWKWYNSKAKGWKVRDVIDYKVRGGRDGGYRGYTYKSNLQSGRWEIDVITKEGLILGTIDFDLVRDTTFSKKRLVREQY
jgi:hypothetical protein